MVTSNNFLYYVEALSSFVFPVSLMEVWLAIEMVRCVILSILCKPLANFLCTSS